MMNELRMLLGVFLCGAVSGFGQTTPVSQFPAIYDFESGSDPWLFSGPDFEWKRFSTNTPSVETGPDKAYEGSWYLYTEASFNFEKTAVLEASFDFSALNAPSISYAYHMYGFDMGSLNFEVSTNSGASWLTLWELSRNQGNAWKLNKINLIAYAGEANVSLRFRGVMGDLRSDMALDEIVVRNISTVEQANQAFFRILSSSDSVITKFDPLAGTLSCSNAVEGATNQLQRSFDLTDAYAWQDFTQLTEGYRREVTGAIIDLDPPEGMVLIPGGVFQMGDFFGEGDGSERPVHSVYISPFYMDKYEVTPALWNTVYNWAITNGYSFDNVGSGNASDRPMHRVSWYDCAKWCNARSEMEGKMPCYTVSGNTYKSGQDTIGCDFNAKGYRLPTEAEWEKAARGGLNGKRFPWGETISHNDANYNSDYTFAYEVSLTRGFHPSFSDGVEPYAGAVGSFVPNGYGLYDMAGNVFEWCWDWDNTAYYASSPSQNPRGALKGSDRVTRGGSWDYSASFCRSAYRGRFNPSGVSNDLGFRTVFSAEPILNSGRVMIPVGINRGIDPEVGAYSLTDALSCVQENLSPPDPGSDGLGVRSVRR